MAKKEQELETMYTPAEVARLFRVDPKTVTRWAKQGRLSAIRTLGGHRRYSKDQVDTILNQLDSVED
jgi:excisionase family DNA binding protein